jgi:DNA-binding GntR family transcriptional regulator
MKPIQRHALTDLVYERIKLMINDGALIPGQKISKKDLTKDLGISQHLSLKP